MSNELQAPNLRKSILKEFNRYTNAVGTDTAVLSNYMTFADRAVSGDLFFSNSFCPPEKRWTHIGRQGIDWSGRHHAHQEWPAQINRFGMLMFLVRAWETTRKNEYAEAAADYVRDWIKAHPSRPGWAMAPYDNKFNLGFRLGLWWKILPRMFDAPHIDDALIESATESTKCQLEFLKTRLDGHNWRIVQGDAFLTCGLLLRSLPESAAWRSFAAVILNDTFRRQILPDGVHIECNPSYHEWITTTFERCWRLNRAFPDLGLTVTTNTLALMHDYVLACRRPNGAWNALHDCMGNAVTGPRAADWDKERREFRRDAGLPDAMPPTIQVFTHAGQACLRDSWDENAVYITFDATTYGGSHCHMSRNAIQLHAYGRSLLVDPGTLNYEKSDPFMAYGKSTRAHNTLNFNGWNQCYANPSPIRHLSASGYECISSLYQGGYWPGRFTWGFDQGNGTGFWAKHHRTLLWIQDRSLLLIMDTVEHSPEPGGAEAWARPVVETCWQFAPGKVRLDAAAGQAVSLYEDANALVCFPLQPPNASLTIHEGESDPLRGWASGPAAAPQVRLSATLAEKCHHLDLATVIVPFAGRAAPEIRVRAESPTYYSPGYLTIEWPDRVRDEILWTSMLGTMVGRAHGMDSDGALVHVRRDDSGQVLQSFASDGTFCDLSPMHDGNDQSGVQPASPT